MKENIIQATVSVALGALAAYFNVRRCQGATKYI